MERMPKRSKRLMKAKRVTTDNSCTKYLVR